MESEICRHTCDVCYNQDMGVMHYHYGEAIMFECRRCGPQAFEIASRKDIDRWLDGVPESNP